MDKQDLKDKKNAMLLDALMLGLAQQQNVKTLDKEQSEALSRCCFTHTREGYMAIDSFIELIEKIESTKAQYIAATQLPGSDKKAADEKLIQDFMELL